MQGRFSGVLAAWLTHKRLSLHLAVIAVILSLPALWIGWQLDDHYHRAVMLQAPDFLSAFWGLQSRGDPNVIHHLMEVGTIPWWTAPDFKLAFFRPLTFLFMWLDYQLWPTASPLMHLHSLVWFGAMVAAAVFLYRRTMGLTWAAGMAALLYAVDEAHALGAAWLGNRYALLATLFGILCLIMYDRWRQEGWIWGAVLSPICLGLALLSGEMALATASYLVAYALFLDQGLWRSRLKALAAHGVVLLLWVAVYRHLGYGAHGSGVYLDPLGEPVAFLSVSWIRLPLLLLGQWSPIPVGVKNFLPEPLANALWVASILLIAVLIYVFYALIREDRIARFWTLGMLLSLPPLLAAYPSNRLLFFVGIGAMGLLARFLEGMAHGGEWLPLSRAWQITARWAGFYFIAVHLILAPFIMSTNAYSMKPLISEPTKKAISSIPADEPIEQQDLIVVNTPSYMYFVSPLRITRMVEGKALPNRLRALSEGPTPVKITRLDERTLSVIMDDGLFSAPMGRVLRSGKDPFHVGQEVQLTGMTARVAGLNDDGDPRNIVYTFSVPLEDPSLIWVRWEKDSYVTFIPPSMGRSIMLPKAFSPVPFNIFRK